MWETRTSGRAKSRDRGAGGSSTSALASLWSGGIQVTLVWICHGLCPRPRPLSSRRAARPPLAVILFSLGQLQEAGLLHCSEGLAALMAYQGLAANEAGGGLHGASAWRWGGSPSLPFTSCVTVGKSLSLLEPQ